MRRASPPAAPASRKACSNSTVPRSTGTEGRFGSHAGSRIATEPTQMSSTRTSVRDHEGFLWGLGGASDIARCLKLSGKPRKADAGGEISLSRWFRLAGPACGAFGLTREISASQPGIFFVMTLRRFSTAVIPLVLTVSAAAQEEDFGSLMGRALAGMNEGKWEEALALHTLAVTRFGAERPLERFGPQFGAVYYHKGVCEMKLKRWEEAMQSFEICYRDFPNTPRAGEATNSFQKTALLKWGEAAMGAKDWELAISRFQKFLKERDKQRDKFAPGAFHIGMAVCFYQLGRIPEGNESLEIAINNKAGFPTPESGIIAGFQALVAAATAKNNERALLDFIGKNRGELIAEPFVMQRYSAVFLKLAADAAAAGMDRAAFELYQFVPATETALDDLRARIKGAAGVADPETRALEVELDALEAAWRGGNAPETIKLAAIAALHEKHGNLRGAFAAYQQLESVFPGLEPT